MTFYKSQRWHSGEKRGFRLNIRRVAAAAAFASQSIFKEKMLYARNGPIPAGSHLNRRHWSRFTSVGRGVPEALESVIFDAQTSGGLLLALPPELAAQACQALEKGGDLACVVGEVLPRRADGKALVLE